MKPRRWLCLVALAVLLFQTTGCYTLRPIEGRLPDSHQGASESERVVLVTMTDGEKVFLKEALVDSTVVRGFAFKSRPQGLREIPLADVRVIEEQHFSLVGTVLILIPIGAAAVGVFLLTGLNRAPSGFVFFGAQPHSSR